MDEIISDTSDNVFGDDNPRVTQAQCQTKIDSTNDNIPDTVLLYPGENRNSETRRRSAALMSAIKGLLDLTSQYLQELECNHTGIGLDLFALLADGTSSAIRGERMYTTQTSQKTNQEKNKSTWAQIATNYHLNYKVISFKKQTLKASVPQGQSKEGARVMIRPSPNHESRKASACELKETIKKLVPDSSLVADVWKVPSGVAILAPTPAKAASILQARTAIEERFGDARVERQETWTTFLIGPVPKRIRCIEGIL